MASYYLYVVYHLLQEERRLVAEAQAEIEAKAKAARDREQAANEASRVEVHFNLE
jgi:hypothetical protein